MFEALFYVAVEVCQGVSSYILGELFMTQQRDGDEEYDYQKQDYTEAIEEGWWFATAISPSGYFFISDEVGFVAPGTKADRWEDM